eukprot:TRINITY_DN11853_c0_g1_i1.p1 TRINITY_DN11853_c0_g1~~TRINITY_DN11853_c0_g1_i1.p1  ORF type:complete len:337 (-),score=69.31 TRINITY_DN11853_c0_g1_i1:374-1303(-)
MAHGPVVTAAQGAAQGKAKDGQSTGSCSTAASETSASPCQSEQATGPPKQESKGGVLKTLVVVAVLACIAYAASSVLSDKKKMQEHIESTLEYIQAQGDNAMYVYLLVTLVGVVCLIPTTPMELAGGFLFSPTYGMWTTLFLTSGAKLIANTISVFIARHVVKDWVTRNLVERSELLTMVSQAVREEPFKMAFLVRGSMVPLCVKNYGLGVMDIGYTPIACCSTIFTTFYAFQNIYLGAACSDLKDVFAPKAKAPAGDGDWAGTLKAMLPVVFNVGLVIFLVKAVKAQIRKQKASMEKDLKDKLSKKGD